MLPCVCVWLYPLNKPQEGEKLEHATLYLCVAIPIKQTIGGREIRSCYPAFVCGYTIKQTIGGREIRSCYPAFVCGYTY